MKDLVLLSGGEEDQAEAVAEEADAPDDQQEHALHPPVEDVQIEAHLRLR